MKKNNKSSGAHAIALLLVMLAATFLCTTAFAAGFTDVPQNHWAYGAINEADSDGVINGVGNNKFDPNGSVTLAQFTTLLTRMMYPAEVEASGATGAWWAKYADVAKNHNFFEYIENTDMNHVLTREEMALVIYNAYPNKAADPANNDAALNDALAEIPDTPSLNHMDSVAFCYIKGILQGVDKDGRFSPKSTMTRAQMATIYVRYKNVLAEKSSTGQPETPAKQPDTPAETGGTPEEMTAEVVRLVNVERAKEGLPPLGTFDSLTRAAQIRAPELVTLFSHERPDGSECFTALDETGASNGAGAMGENIAAGVATAAEVVEQWMNSPGHRANILSADFTHIGVGYQQASSGYGHYWVQMFVGE